MSGILAAAVLLLVALVGAGWAEMTYEPDTGLWTDGMTYYEPHVLGVTEYENGLTATSEVLVPVPGGACILAEFHGDVYWCEKCQKWYQRQEGMVVENCCVIHQPGDCCHYREREMTVSAMTDEAESVPTGTFMTVEPAPVFEPVCACCDHDWRQVYRVQAYVKALYPPESKDGYPAYVDLQSCSRCGILRVRP